MTREEAVEKFKGIRKSFSISIAQVKFYPSKAILDELCDMAIEALQELPKRRKEAKRWKRKALQAESVKHGEWIVDEKHTEEIYTNPVYCSACGKDVVMDYGEYAPYCPNCGADMRGDKE